MPEVGSRYLVWFGLVWFGLVSLFIQGKPLASGYYSRHPETTQYNKDKDKEKRKTEERTQKSKSTVAGENSKCSMQQLNIQVSVFIEMRVSQKNNMQLFRIPQGIQIHVVRKVESATGMHQCMQMHVAQKLS